MRVIEEFSTECDVQKYTIESMETEEKESQPESERLIRRQLQQSTLEMIRTQTLAATIGTERRERELYSRDIKVRMTVESPSSFSLGKLRVNCSWQTYFHCHNE